MTSSCFPVTLQWWNAFKAISFVMCGIRVVISPCQLYLWSSSYPSVSRKISVLTGFPGRYCTLHWRHNWPHGVSNNQSHHCLLNRLFRRRSKKISKIRVTVLCAGNSPVTGEFPAQRASNAQNFSTWWRHHDKPKLMLGLWKPHRCIDLSWSSWVCPEMCSLSHSPNLLAIRCSFHIHTKYK